MKKANVFALKKRKREMILLLFAIFFFQFISPMIVFGADVPQNLTGQTDYLIVHNTTDSYSGIGGPSIITVTDTNGDPVPASGNTYSNVPAGSSLVLTCVFHLADGDGMSFYTYSDGSYFEFTLPEGLTFEAPTVTESQIMATDVSTGSWLMGTWQLLADGQTVRVNFTDDLNNHQARWGAVRIEGTFNALEDDESPESTLLLGSQTVTFERELPPPPEITLEKEGVYVASDNTIEWTVTVQPPAGVSLTGLTLKDVYTSNQTYVANSFNVNGSGVADSLLRFSTNTVIYTFPDPATGTYVIKYKTSPSSFGAETGATNKTQSTFKNTASLMRDADTVKGPVEDSVALNWIDKNGSVEDASQLLMRWVIDVNVPAGGTITDVAVVDTLSSGQQLYTAAGYEPQYRIGTGSFQTFGTGTADGQYSASGSNVTFYLPDLSASVRIVYYTVVSDPQTSLNTNNSVVFSNNADLIWEEMPDSDNPPKDPAQVTLVPGGGLIDKNAGSDVNYGPGKEYIKWTITVNRNKITVADANVSDTIPTGQQLIIDASHPFVVKKNGVAIFQTTSAVAGGGLTSSDFLHGFVFTFADEDTDAPGVAIAATYTVEYYTRVVDTTPGNQNDTTGLELLYSNSTVEYKNTAVLGRSSAGGSINRNGSQKYFSQMISKAVVQEYNYADRTVKWQITVNRNQIQLTNGIISDTLPAGMVLLMGGGYDFIVQNMTTSTTYATQPTTGVNGSTGFTVDLPASTSDRYRITFYTRLTDEGLLAQGQGSDDYTNIAYLNADEVSDLSSSATVSVGNPIISKGHDYENGSDHIDWSVVINTGQVDLLNAVVSDDLHDNLMLDPDSIALYRVSITSSGAVGTAVSGTLVDAAAYSVTLPTPTNGNLLTVELPDGPYVYRLEFTTYIISDDLNVVNTIELTGSSSSPTGTSHADRIIINDLWSSGGSGSKTLTVYKTDALGDPVEGATYRLLNFNKDPIMFGGNYVEAVTDASGNALFSNLPDWVFYVIEVDAPAGYLLNPDFLGGQRLTNNMTYDTVDAQALGTLRIIKESTDGKPLNGGVFTLTGVTYDNEVIVRTAASVNGVVTFTDLPIGLYSVQETVAPKGYIASKEIITATVEYNGDKTDVNVTITSDAQKLVNEPVPLPQSGSPLDGHVIVLLGLTPILAGLLLMLKRRRSNGGGV